MEQETAEYKICPNCGKRMIKWTIYPGQRPWEWRCGCGYTEAGGISRWKTKDEIFLGLWELAQAGAQWNKVDLDRTVFLKDGKQYIAEIISQYFGSIKLLRMTEIEGIDDNGEAIRKGA